MFFKIIVIISGFTLLGFAFGLWGPGNPMRFIDSPCGFGDPQIPKYWVTGTAWGLILGLLISSIFVYFKFLRKKPEPEPEQQLEPEPIIVNVNTGDDEELARIFTPEEIQRIHINREAAANCGIPGQKPFYCNHHLWTTTDPDGFRPVAVLQFQDGRVEEIMNKLSRHEIQFKF